MSDIERGRAFERAWTAREDRQLLRSYGTTDTALLAERFGRSPEAIRVRAKRIGAATPRSERERPWTKDEEQFVMEPKYTAGEKARLLHRSRGSVLWKTWQIRQRARVVV